MDTPEHTPKPDSIAVLEDVIATQPDGSPLTPKLQDVIDDIKRLRGLAGAASASVKEPDHRSIRHGISKTDATTVFAKPKDEIGQDATKPRKS